MASTNFIPGTVITSEWLNEVDEGIFETLPSISSTASGKGASMVGVEDSAGYWAGATQEAVNTEAGSLLVNLKSLGADITGATPADSLMAAAFALSSYVLIPAGCIISLDAPFIIPAGAVLWIGPNSTVKRRAAAASTGPVLKIQAKSASIIGSGASSIVESEKDCPDGIIRLGADSMSVDTPTDCQFNAVRNLRIRGSRWADENFPNYGKTSGSPDCGIVSCNPQISGAVVSYFHRLTDLWISGVNYCVHLQGFANANQIRDLHLERFGSSGVPGRGIFFEGAQENNIVNVWHHFAPYSTAMYFARVVGVRNYDAAWNVCMNVQSEAGSNANMVTFDANSFENIAHGTDNNGLPSSITGTQNCIQTTDSWDVPGQLTVRNVAASNNAIRLYAAAGQTANVLQIRSGAGGNLFNVDPAGNASAEVGVYAKQGIFPSSTAAVGVGWRSGAGTPEGVISAPVGSLWTRTDGGNGTTLYVKQSGTGNTGWAAK